MSFTFAYLSICYTLVFKFSELFNLIIKVSERILGREEIPWESLKQIGRESLRQMQRTRFYLQPKEVPCEENLAVFVSNLPFNLSQRQYEKILLDILGKGIVFVLLIYDTK